ncbi:MAG: hypothetical protein EOP32_15330 [Rhodococcus sp. (in: high G+C Gram-positive bacteria)]|nr:MAG: hypothetical protein EOP32_15330 [Rhodococcus sp. (in: high G+C Gram-positive bacteria)]
MYTITDRAALLTDLERIRENGFALIDNEREEELISLSRSSGNLVAIVSLNGPRYQFGPDRIPEGLQQMQLLVDRLVDAFWRESGATGVADPVLPKTAVATRPETVATRPENRRRRGSPVADPAAAHPYLLRTSPGSAQWTTPETHDVSPVLSGFSTTVLGRSACHPLRGSG